MLSNRGIGTITQKLPLTKTVVQGRVLYIFLISPFESHCDFKYSGK